MVEEDIQQNNPCNKLIDAHARVTSILQSHGIKGAPAREQLDVYLAMSENIGLDSAREVVQTCMDQISNQERFSNNGSPFPQHSLHKLKFANRLAIPLNVAVVVVSARFIKANKREVSFQEFNDSLKRFLHEELFIPDEAISGVTRENVANNLRKRRVRGDQVVTVSPFSITNDEMRQAYQIANDKNKERLPEIDEIRAALKEVREGAVISIDLLRRRCNELKLPFKTLKPVEKQNQKIVAYYGEYYANKGVRPNTEELEEFIRNKGDGYSRKEIANAIYSKRRYRKEGENDFKLRLGFTDNEIRTAHKRALKKMTDRRPPSPKEVKQALPKKLKEKRIALDQIRRRCKKIGLKLRKEEGVSGPREKYLKKVKLVLGHYNGFLEIYGFTPRHDEFLAYLADQGLRVPKRSLKKIIYAVNKQKILGGNYLYLSFSHSKRNDNYCAPSEKTIFINQQYDLFVKRHDVKPTIFELLTKAQALFPDVNEADLIGGIRGRLIANNGEAGGGKPLVKSYDSPSQVSRLKGILSDIYRSSRGVSDLGKALQGWYLGITERRLLDCIDDLNRLHGGVRLPFLLGVISGGRFSDTDYIDSIDQQRERRRAINILNSYTLLSDHKPTKDSSAKAFSDLLFLTKYLVNLRNLSESARSNMFEINENLFTKGRHKEFSSQSIQDEQGGRKSDTGNQLIDYMSVLNAGIGCRLFTRHAVLEHLPDINWAPSSTEARQIMVQFMRQNLSRWFSIPFRGL